MISVGTYHAKTHLAQLLERVEQGETVLVTRHGKPIARIVPASHAAAHDPTGLAERFEALRAAQPRSKPGEQPVWRMKHDEHRY